MWAPKYQCGRVKLDQLGAHMAPGVLKLFATLRFMCIVLHQFAKFNDNHPFTRVQNCPKFETHL